MKIALFVGRVDPHGIELRSNLQSKGYNCISTEEVDEIDQVGKQLGKIVLVFHDHKLAYKILSENRWVGFSSYNIFYPEKKPVISKDAQVKLNKVALHVYTPMIQEKLFEELNKFQLNEKNEEEDIEIEFSIHEELRKKHD